MHIHRHAAKEGTRGVRAWITVRRHQDGPEIARGRFEGYIASGAQHTGIGLSGDEDGIQLFIGVAHVADVWVTGQTTRLAKWLANRFPRLDDTNVVSLTFHDRAAWWEVWHDKWSWSKGTPRWRSGNFHWFDWLTGKAVRSEETIEGPVEIGIPMPEGNYLATVTVTRSTWKRPRWPWPNHHNGYNVDIISRPGPDGPYVPDLNGDGRRPSGYIPVPGKGENAWDCGGDGVFGMSGPGRTIESAIAGVVQSALRDRRRNGGDLAYAEPIEPRG